MGPGHRYPLRHLRGDDIVPRPQTLTAFSRGTQLSVLGWRNVPLCGTCDHDELMRSTRAGGPLAAGYRPAAVHPRDGHHDI